MMIWFRIVFAKLKFIPLLFTGIGCLALGGSGANAASGVGDPPIYDPASKSYFQLLGLHNSAHQSETQKLSAKRSYKGARGRLAIVNSYDTHRFIVKKFDLSEPTWIGLRYWCRYGMLEWNGKRPYSAAKPGHFHAWHPQWYRNAQFICQTDEVAEMGFMPVYYRQFGPGTVLWQASGPRKGFSRFLVQYPTNGK
jgi:hypothetical protein